LKTTPPRDPVKEVLSTSISWVMGGGNEGHVKKSPGLESKIGSKPDFRGELTAAAQKNHCRRLDLWRFGAQRQDVLARKSCGAAQGPPSPGPQEQKGPHRSHDLWRFGAQRQDR